MPKWSTDGDAFLQTVERKGPEPELPNIPEVFEKSTLGTSIADQIKQAAAGAKNRAKGAGQTLQVDAVGASNAIRLDDGTGVDEVSLDQVRARIKAEEYEKALALLVEFLRARPGHAVALYLRGLCECRTGQAETALRTIAPVIPSASADLRSPLRQLRLDIQEQMIPDVSTLVLLFTVTKQSDQAVRRLRELLGLDREVGFYHCLLVHSLISAGDLAGARAAATAASPFCHNTDAEMLATLTGKILQSMLDGALELARRSYRAANYRKARKQMEEIRSEWGSQPLWIVYYEYLQALGGGLLSRGKHPRECRPSGAAEVVDRLHFMLIREELSAARQLLGAKHADQSLTPLRAGLELAPHFPYLHYMLAQATYLALLASMDTDEKPAIEWVEQQLTNAMQFAQYGAQDKEIEDVPKLVAAIKAAQQMVAEGRKAREQADRDFAVLRPMIDEFGQIRKGGEGGIESVAQFRSLGQRMKALREKIGKVKAQLKSETGRETVAQFLAAVDKDLVQFREMEPEMEIAEKISEFQNRLSTILPTGGTKPPLSSVLASLKKLKGDIRDLANKTKLSKDAGQAVKQLAETVDRLLSEAEQAAPVNAFLEKFDRAASPLKNRTKPLDFMDALTLKTDLTEIAAEGDRLLRTLKEGEGRKAVQQVTGIAKDLLSKLR